MSPIDLLPTELLLLVCKELPAASTAKLALASRRLYNICLPEAFSNHPKSRCEALIWACENGFINTARSALAAGASASEHSKKDPVVFPMGKKFNFAQENGSGQPRSKGITFHLRKTTLAIAIMQGHVDIFEMLLAHGATQEEGLRIRMRNDWGDNPGYYQWFGECSPFLLVRHMPMYRALLSAGFRDIPMGFNDYLIGQDGVGRCLPTLSWLIIRSAETEVIKAAIANGHATLSPIVGEIPPLPLACQYAQYETAMYLTDIFLDWVRSGPGTDFPDLMIKPRDGYNAAIWYGLLSLKAGFWNTDATKQMIRFLHRSVELGLDVNNAIIAPTEAPLLHLAMLPHVDTSVTESLLSLRADPASPAPITLDDYWMFAYGTGSIFFNGRAFHGRPDKTYPQGTDPLQSLLWTLEGQAFGRIPSPPGLLRLHCSETKMTSNFEANQRRKLASLAKWTLQYCGWDFIRHVFKNSKSTIYALTLLKDVSKLIDLKKHMYKNLIQFCLGDHYDWDSPLDGTFDALATAVELCAAHGVSITEHTQDSTADFWSRRYLATKFVANHFQPLTFCQQCLLTADVDGRWVDMDVKDYQRWVAFLSNWTENPEAYSVEVWRLFKREVQDVRDRNEERIRAACLLLDRKRGRDWCQRC